MNAKERTPKFFALCDDLVQNFASRSEVCHNPFTIDSNNECKVRQDSFKNKTFFENNAFQRC
jgi:hypothetical protein